MKTTDQELCEEAQRLLDEIWYKEQDAITKLTEAQEELALVEIARARLTRKLSEQDIYIKENDEEIE